MLVGITVPLDEMKAEDVVMVVVVVVHPHVVAVKVHLLVVAVKVHLLVVVVKELIEICIF